MKWWPWRKARDLVSIGSPASADLFRFAARNYSGVAVGESTALGLSAVYRAVSLVSGTLAGLPMRTHRDAPGSRTTVPSVLDDPGAVADMTPYEWRETVLLHLLLHGNAFLAHVRNGAGGLAGLVPVHPLAVTIDDPPMAPAGDGLTPMRTYTATLANGTRAEFTPATMTHIPALRVDLATGRGLSPIAVARNSLGIAVAGDRAAANMFSDGALMGGLVTPDDDDTEFDAKEIKEQLDAKLSGWENAAALAVVNRRLKFTPWTINPVDAQFLQSRQFQVEEIARWYGVPPHLLMQTEKQTSWGTGVAEQNRGLARFTLAPWAQRIEQRLSRLLPAPRFVAFDFGDLLRPAPEQEIPLVLSQVAGGLITPNEGRKRLGYDPIEGGDTLRGAESVPAAPEPEGVPA